jgi:DNA polymerase bacteriophage-type
LSKIQQSPLAWVWGDFESFYSKDYSLRHMDPPSYILDERFEAICLSLVEGKDSTAMLVDGPYIQGYVDTYKKRQAAGERIAFVSHNALFDACILAWRFGFVPDLIVCTLSMARTLLRSELRSVSLDSVSRHFGMQKGKTIFKVSGMSRADIIANGMWAEYTNYCMNDTQLCRAIFYKMIKDFPAEEIVLQDMILRCAIEPRFIADLGMLQTHLANVQVEKTKLMIKAYFCGLTSRDELMSNPQFAEVLQRRGIRPPRKVSYQTGQETWAFSKQDREFLALLEHDDPKVSTLVEARLVVKSTLEESRAERLINIAQLPFPGLPEHVMPIPLKMGAAITHRLGGDWDCNPQNWGRKSPIRKAMRAPEGYKVVVADAEQIEARLTAWFCGQQDLVNEFARGEDVYANFAQTIYHVPVTKSSQPAKRFVGKTGILQLGYQSGPGKFRSTVWLLSYNSEPEPIELTEDEARNIVYGYRTKMDWIVDMWGQFKDLIPEMASNPKLVRQIGPITIRGNKIIGPNGLTITYRNLRQELDVHGKLNWVYDYGGGTYRLFGGKLLENVIQFLARIAVMQAAIRLKPLLIPFGSQLTHTAHDEIVYIVKDEYVADVETLVDREMSLTPAWAPGLPLKTSVTHGQTYGDAK